MPLKTPQQPLEGNKHDDPVTIEFPGCAPKRHQARAWGMAMDSLLTTRGLTSVARNKLPPGMFRRPWSDEALQPPPALPARPSYKDQLARHDEEDQPGVARPAARAVPRR